MTAKMTADYTCPPGLWLLPAKYMTAKMTADYTTYFLLSGFGVVKYMTAKMTADYTTCRSEGSSSGCEIHDRQNDGGLHLISLVYVCADSEIHDRQNDGGLHHPFTLIVASD